MQCNFDVTICVNGFSEHVCVSYAKVDTGSSAMAMKDGKPMLVAVFKFPPKGTWHNKTMSGSLVSYWTFVAKYLCS